MGFDRCDRRAGRLCHTLSDRTAAARPKLWYDSKKQKHRENGQVDDALEYCGPARAQRDDADKKGQRQQDFIFLSKPKRNGLVEYDRKHSDCWNRHIDTGKSRAQGQVQAGL